ncbi:MAG: helix-turn-helix domain-containing protein [Anaerolineae bacterium]
MAGKQELAEGLRRLRMDCQVGQAELAREMKIGTNRLWYYEKGERRISPEMRERYIGALEDIAIRRLESARAALRKIALSAEQLRDP